MQKRLRIVLLLALPFLLLGLLLNSNYNSGKAGESNNSADTVVEVGQEKEACAGTRPLTPELIGKFKNLGFREFELPADQARMELVDLAGEPVRLDDYAGTWVLLNFWSRRCPPCLRELSPLQNFREELHVKNFEVLGVNLKADRSSIQKTKQEFELDFPLLWSESSEKGIGIAKDYKVRILPTTILISPAGRPRLKLLGPLQWDSARIKGIFSQLCFASDTAPETQGEAH